MSSADDIRRWSDELARDPSSLVFLELGDTLRREGQLELAMKIAGRGLARHSGNVSANDLVLRIAADRAERDSARASQEFTHSASAPPPPGMPAPVVPADAPPAHEVGLAAEPEDEAQAVFVDGQGLIVAGYYLDSDGQDVAEEMAAQLSGISDEAMRAARHLELGPWRTLLFETDVTVVGLAPTDDGGMVLVSAPRAMPLGMLRRLLARCVAQAAVLVRGGGMTTPFTPMVDRLARGRGVRGSLVVSESDGLIIDASLRIGQRGDHVAALAASVFRKARRVAEAARLGAPAFLQVDAEHGHICVAGRGDLVVIVVAEPTANIGLIRVELLNAVQSLI